MHFDEIILLGKNIYVLKTKSILFHKSEVIHCMYTYNINDYDIINNSHKLQFTINSLKYLMDILEF